MMWAVGILLTVLLSVAGLFSFRQFDRQIDFTSRRVAAEQRVEFERRLEADLKELEKKNSALVSQAIEDLQLESRFALRMTWGAIFVSLKDPNESVDSFSHAVKLYASERGRTVLTKKQGTHALNNLCIAIKMRDKDDFEESLKKKLQEEPYNDLREELDLAAKDLPWLGPLLPWADKMSEK